MYQLVFRFFFCGFQNVSFLTSNRFLEDSNDGRLSSTPSTFKARVSSMVHRFSRIRIVFSGRGNVTFLRRFIRCVRRRASVFRVGPNDELVRGVRHFTNVALKRFHDRFRALTLSTQRNNKKLSRFGVSWPRLLRRFSFVRGLERVLGRLCDAVSNRIRCVNCKFALVTRFRHLTIVSFTIAGLTECRRVKRRVRFSNLMSIATTDLTTSSNCVRQRAPQLVAASLHFKRASGRVPSVQRCSYVNNQVKAQYPTRQQLIRVRRLVCVIRSLRAIVKREFLREAMRVL